MNWLVDLGKLVFVSASNPRDAYHLASLSEFGVDEEIPSHSPVIYQLDDKCNIVEVYA